MNGTSQGGGRSFRRAVGALAVVIPLAVLAWFLRPATGPRKEDTTVSQGPAPARPVKPSQVADDYVGSLICRDCHRDIWERYQTHPMARSLSPVGAGDGVEDYGSQTEFTRGKRSYAVERVGEKVFHHERQNDQQGDTIYDQAVEVHFGMGSGKRGRSYLIDRGGLLFMSPISWYSQSGRWDLSPGYPEDAHQRFERRIVDRCVSCHAGRAAPDPDWCDRFREESPILEFGIGCERCHGPAAEHVARQQSGAPLSGNDPIVNPARLDPPRRESVCNQCHLHGEELLRYGRADFDFRPGMNVGDVWSIVVDERHEPGSDSTGAVSQVQQMLASVCSQRSAGRLGCISCHDPHSAPAESEKHAVFREKCLACHATADCTEDERRRQEPAVGDSCILCHMPRLAASDIPHTSQTDHRVPRRAGDRHRGLHRAAQGNAPEPTVFDAAAVPLSTLERSRVRGFMLAKAAGKSRSAVLARKAAVDLEPVLKACPDDRRAADALAFAWVLSKREAEAIDLWKRMLNVPPVREETLISLVTVSQQQRSPDAALEHLDQLLALNPWRARFWLQRSQLLHGLGRDREALEAARRALSLDPSSTDSYRQAVDLCQRLGLTHETERFQAVLSRLAAR